jgi:hypothetical protein
MVGALVGAIDGAMALSDHSWFPGMNTESAKQHFEGSQSVIYTNAQDQSAQGIGNTIAAQPTDKDPSDTGSYLKAFNIGVIVWDTLKGILYIKGIIDDTISVPNPDPLSQHQNMFGGFSLIIQLGVWCIYGMGALQYWNKVMMKYAY